MAKRNLVVVESRAKAKTIEKFLGGDYAVEACFGHVRDLPSDNLGIDVEDDFSPTYVISPERAEVVRRLRKEARDADVVFLASDPDREGEAIAWHLVEAMRLGHNTVRRIEFHEVTRDAVLRAVREPRDIDLKRVDAQQARRVVDRLVGYKISPILWKNVPGDRSAGKALSAGRVQSVAVRLVVDREREREAFVPVEYWSLEAELAKRVPGAQPFTAALTKRDGEKIELHAGADAERVIDDLNGASYRVGGVEKSARQRHPAAPFTTSTLQQDASRKLGLSAKRTMAVAQQLYEGIQIGGGEGVGLITYMRTDSVIVAETAVQEVRRVIAAKYGQEMLPERARAHKTKSRLAQEAHEAIRPTATQRDPESVRAYLDRDQFRLYELIWKRFVASQMASALFDDTTVDIEAASARRPTYMFRVTGSVLRFAGFLSVYLEGKEEGEAEDDKQRRLPELRVDEELDLLKLIPEQHFTQPPPRYSEATLVKALEERGIGRPSTYAPTLSTIQDRGYVERDGKPLKPTDLGRVVNDLLVGHFSNIVDVNFTANLEEKLDEIATGDREWVPVVREFYTPFEQTLERAQREIQHVNKTAEVSAEQCEKCGRPMAIKLGRNGRFLSCTGYPECKGTQPIGGRVEAPPPEPTDETCTNCGKPMQIRTGRFGRFIACTDYPQCKTSKPIMVKLGLRCPKCGTGELVEKKSRRGKIFYGCAEYPTCDWVTWRKPLAEPCGCGALRIPLSGDRIHCLGCDGELPTRRSTDGDSSKAAGGRGRSAARAGVRASGARGAAVASTNGRNGATSPTKVTKATRSTPKPTTANVSATRKRPTPGPRARKAS